MTANASNVVRPDATFETMFFPVNREVPFGCEVCSEKVEKYYQLDGDFNSAYSCATCAAEYVEEVRAGVWEW
jgi:hypothetical protein